MNLVRRLYGAHPLHLLVLLACFAIAGYAAVSATAEQQWPRMAWWFLAAVVAHDLVLFPLYAAADRLLTRAAPGRCRISVVNHVRLPALAAGLLFLLFFPGILEQGRETYFAATGQTQQPFLARWLMITAALFTTSALSYVGRLLALARARSASRA